MIPVFDKRMILAIARRAADIYASHGKRINPEYIASEIELVHDRIVRLRINDMLRATPGNLMHDVSGIHQHLNIETTPPTFTHCFVPRFAAHTVSQDAV